MPKLPEYTAPLGDLPIGAGQRRASALDFGGATAEALGGLGQAGAKVYDDVGDKESRDALIKTTAIRAKYAEALNNAATNEQDLSKLRLQMNDELSAVGDSFQTGRGQSALQLHSIQANAGFEEQSNSIEIHRAGVQARTAASSFLTNATKLLQLDPTALPIVLKQADDLSHTFGRADIATKAEISKMLRSELNVGAAMNTAINAPELAYQGLNHGAWDLTPEQATMVRGHADAAVRTKRIDEEYAYTLAERKLHAQDDASRDQYFKMIRNDMPDVGAAILHDKKLLPATREHLTNVLDAFNKEQAAARSGHKPVSDYETLMSLWQEVHAPEGTPGKTYTADHIYAAVANHLLTTEDADKLNTQQADLRDPNNQAIGSRINLAFDNVGKSVNANPMFTKQPALVAAIQMDYQARVYDKVNSLRKQHIDPLEAFNPKSPHYVGSEDFIQQSIDSGRNMKQNGLVTERADTRARTMNIDGTVFTWNGKEPYKGLANWSRQDGSSAASSLEVEPPGNVATGKIKYPAAQSPAKPPKGSEPKPIPKPVQVMPTLPPPTGR